jgi:hypothetical protein
MKACFMALIFWNAIVLKIKTENKLFAEILATTTFQQLYFFCLTFISYPV